jgi:4,5-DOPA dioxygenase extradiol
MDRRTFLGALGGAAGAATLRASFPGPADHRDAGGRLMPAFFIGHGSPLNAIEDNRFTRGWTEAMKDVPPPAAILCVSAHWLTRGTYVTTTSRPRTIHDHRVASRELKSVQYPAPGSPGLAAEIAGAVRTTSVVPDDARGLDQGTWPILRQAFPGAEVPVLQMSIDVRRPGSWHYDLGRELLDFRRRGVLVIGSGNIVHNLREADLELACDGFEWSVEADEVVKAKIRAGDHGALCEHEKLGRVVSLAVPTPDHYYPLLYVLGMQTPDDRVTIFNDALAYGGVTMTSVRLGA